MSKMPKHMLRKEKETSCPRHSVGRQKPSSQGNKQSSTGTQYTQRETIGKSIMELQTYTGEQTALPKMINLENWVSTWRRMKLIHT